MISSVRSVDSSLTITHSAGGIVWRTTDLSVAPMVAASLRTGVINTYADWFTSPARRVSAIVTGVRPPPGAAGFMYWLAPDFPGPGNFWSRAAPEDGGTPSLLTGAVTPA